MSLQDIVECFLPLFIGVDIAEIRAIPVTKETRGSATAGVPASPGHKAAFTGDTHTVSFPG